MSEAPASHIERTIASGVSIALLVVSVGGMVWHQAATGKQVLITHEETMIMRAEVKILERDISELRARMEFLTEKTRDKTKPKE
jgi:ubiquinone biosynthesis protein UbiJ